MTRIIVCVKQAIDITQLKIDPVTRRPLVESAPRKISDIDKNALEEAVRLREKQDGEVIALTLGDENAKTAVRESLAMGADRAYHLNDVAFANVDTHVTSLVLAEAIKKIGAYDLVLCGETSIDSFSGVTSQRIAERLDIPLIMYARSIDLENGVVKAERTLENSAETVKAKTPALIAVVKGINEPRIPSLMTIMKASKKEITVWNAETLGLTSEKLTPTLDVTEILAPRMERKKIMLKGETPAEVAYKLSKALMQEGVIER